MGNAMHTRWRLVTAVFVILWLFGLVAVYFWAHKPFDTAVLAGVGRTLGSLAGWLGLSALAAALGRRLAGDLLAGASPVARLALAVGLGLGLLGLLTLLLGLLGWLRPLAAWLLVAGLAVGLRREWPRLLRELRALWTHGLWPRAHGRFQRWLRLYAAAALGLTGLMALTPDTSWDALVYHLTGPRLFIAAGRVAHPIDLPYLGFPQLLEMQFTLGMLLAGDGVAPLLQFGYGLLALALTATLARAAFGDAASGDAASGGDASGDAAAWGAAAILLSVPLLLELMQQAYVDAALLYYVTAVATLLLRELRSAECGVRNAEWGVGRSLLLGVTVGLALGVKYTAVFLPFAVLLVLLWPGRAAGRRARMAQATLVMGAAGLTFLPWLLKNWLTTGNPVYPFLLTDALYWDPWRAWWYGRGGTGLATTAPWRLLTAPLEAALLGTTGSDFYDATIGPFALGLLALLPITWRAFNPAEKRAARLLLLLFGAGYALWLAGLAHSALLRQTRLLLPTFGITAVLGGAALARIRPLPKPRLAVDWLARAAFSLALGLLLFGQARDFVRVNPLPVALGLETADAYLQRRLGSYHTAVTAVNHLPPAGQVVFLWEPRSYACRVACRPDALLDRWLHLTRYRGYDADAIADAWRAEGVTHVLLHQRGLDFIVDAGFDPITARDLAILHDLQTRRLEQLAAWDNDYILYALPP
jgi:hypothetical protein